MSIRFSFEGYNEIFCYPVDTKDTFWRVASMIKRDFSIDFNIELSFRIYGSELPTNDNVANSVRPTDIIKISAKSGEKIKFMKELIFHKQIEKFIIYSTANFHSMVNGDQIEININDDFPKIYDTVSTFLKKKYFNVAPMNMHLYLPGGIPFVKGTFSHFKESFPDCLNHLYAVFIRKDIPDNLLAQKMGNVVDIRNTRKLILSPVIDSTAKGLCQIASVLGYIAQDAENVMRLIYSLAKIVPFAPLSCSLYRLANRNAADGYTIVQITSSLFTLFKEMAKEKIDDENIFTKTSEYLTYFMNMKISENVPCTQFESPFMPIGYETYFKELYPNEKDEKIIVAWDPDFRGTDWVSFKFNKLTETEIEDANDETESLKIVPPLSLREMKRVSLFDGKNGAWLFLAASASKDRKMRDTLDFIDPEVGEISNSNPESLAKLTISGGKNTTINDTIDPKKVKQIVFIVVDESGSMSCGFDAGSRFDAARQFFVTFTNRCYTFHENTLYGLISFTGSVNVRQELSPMVSDFEKAIDLIRPSGCTSMFSAMKVAADKLILMNRDNKYPNAIPRMLVITDGGDNSSSRDDIISLPNLLIDNKIRVDSIIIGDIERRLIAMTKYTGGVCFCPDRVVDGINFFDQEAFFNVGIRLFGPFHSRLTDPENEINSAPNVHKNSLDKRIPIKQDAIISTQNNLGTPLYIVNHFQNQPNQQRNLRRILREIKIISNDPDPDVIVRPVQDKIDFWRVLIKGPEGSLYNGRWFSLTCDFPEDYPKAFPLLRFQNPPFHPNITDTGRICLDQLEIAYNSTYSMKVLLSLVKGLLLEPNFNDPVDLNRLQLCKFERNTFDKTVNDWNNRNGRSTADEWLKDWKIMDDPNQAGQAKNHSVDIPQQFICPLSHKLMKEPVLATSKILYERRALKQHVETNLNPKCVVTGKDLDKNKDANLVIDIETKQKIQKWIDDNKYVEEFD